MEKLNLNSMMSKTSYFYKAIEKENKQLKEQLKKKEKEIEELQEQRQKSLEYTSALLYQGDKLQKQNTKYKQAIDTIRGIAIERNYLNLDEALDDILQIINEVEEC